MYANVSVPVVPDPNYLQQLYPTVTPPIASNTVTAPTTAATEGSTQPMDIMTIVNLAITAGLGYFLKNQKTTTDRRTYMAADTTVKLAANDEATDAKQLKLVYAVSCMADIMGKYHREDMETYETIEGVSLWTYIENLRISYNQDFQARYVHNGPVATTGTQSKDKVVATFNKVQQSITPTVDTTTIPDVTKTTQKRVELNKESNKEE